MTPILLFWPRLNKCSCSNINIYVFSNNFFNPQSILGDCILLFPYTTKYKYSHFFLLYQYFEITCLLLYDILHIDIFFVNSYFISEYSGLSYFPLQFTMVIFFTPHFLMLGIMKIRLSPQTRQIFLLRNSLFLLSLFVQTTR